MLYKTGCWVVKNQHENKINLAEMKIFCWMYSKTSHDKIINENIRELTSIVEKMVKNRLK